MLTRAVRAGVAGSRASGGRPPERRALLAGIHATAKQLGMPDEDRRDFQRHQVGVLSCKDMDLDQLHRIDRELRRLARVLPAASRASSRLRAEAPSGAQARGASVATDSTMQQTQRRKRRGRDERQPDEPPTKEQLQWIEHLYAHLGVRASSAMMGLSRRITGHAWPQTRAEANKLIEGLKAMDKRNWRPSRQADMT